MAFHYRNALVSGIALVLFIVVFSSVPGGGIVLPELINSGHAVVFFCANLFVLYLLFGLSASAKQIWIVSLGSLFIGLIIELVQPYIGRDRSILDLVYDLIGISFSAFFYIQRRTNPKRFPYLLLVVFLCFATAIPVFRMYLWWQINQAPTLLNFERYWESFTYSMDKDVSLQMMSSQDLFNTNGHAGKLSFGNSDTYLGFSFNYPKNDWREYKKLSWEMFSPHEHIIPMSLRIHDSSHDQEYSDRFNYRFEIKPGYNLFEVSLSEVSQAPRSRNMDMSEIQNMKFFVYQPSAAISIYLDNVQLR